jgi:phosphatidate cytidylyltransferase
MDANMLRRVAFAAVAIPLALLLVWNGGWPLALLVSAIAVLGVREVFDLAGRQGIEAFRRTGMVLAGGSPLAVYAALVRPEAATWLAANGIFVGVGAVLLVLGLALWRRAPDQRPLGAVAVTLFGVIYAGLLPTFLLAIRHAEWPVRSWGGTALVFFPLVVTWVCDTAAMFAGKAIGGPKLAPVMSPGKTLVGGLAGLVAGALAAVAFAAIALPPVGLAMSAGTAALIGIALATVGQLGDLAESLFKREAGVKDSSDLIPGHGGVLDRFDSLYVVLPVAALCLRLAGLQ